MKVNGLTWTFDSNEELHDVMAALIAYAQRVTSVAQSDIVADYGLNHYTGNARRTVSHVIEQLGKHAVSENADQTFQA